MPPLEKVKFDKLNQGKPKLIRQAKDENLMFDDQVMISKFNVNSITNPVSQQRLGSNNFVETTDRWGRGGGGEDKDVIDYFSNVNGEDITTNQGLTNLIGKRQIDFLKFCKIMKVFSWRSPPEEKINCKLFLIEFILCYLTMMKMIELVELILSIC